LEGFNGIHVMLAESQSFGCGMIVRLKNVILFYLFDISTGQSFKGLSQYLSYTVRKTVSG
jgi:hypothetical protein